MDANLLLIYFYTAAMTKADFVNAMGRFVEKIRRERQREYNGQQCNITDDASVWLH